MYNISNGECVRKTIDSRFFGLIPAYYLGFRLIQDNKKQVISIRVSKDQFDSVDLLQKTVVEYTYNKRSGSGVMLKDWVC